MKFRVERDVLADALAWSGRTLPARPPVPVLAGMLLEVADRLTVSSFDYEVSARATVDVEVGEPGRALVPGRLLGEIARNLPPAPVDVTSDAGRVAVTCGGIRFTLQTLPVEDYPSLPSMPTLAGTVPGDVFAEAVGQVVVAASRDETLPMLTGVRIEIEGAELTLAATDRYRIAVRRLAWTPARPDIAAAALVPARTLGGMARALPAGSTLSVALAVDDRGAGESGPQAPRRRTNAAPRDAVGSVASGSLRGANAAPGDAAGSVASGSLRGIVGFGSDDRSMTTSLLDGQFVPWRSRFPTEFAHRATVPTAPFTEAVKRVGLVAERSTPVRLSFSPGEVVLEAASGEQAQAVEALGADFGGGENVPIAFNPQFLLDGLNALGADSACLRFSGPTRPALLTAGGPDAARTEGGPSQDGPGEGGTHENGRPGVSAEPAVPAFRYLLMPVRV